MIVVATVFAAGGAAATYPGSIISSFDARIIEGSATIYPVGVAFGDGYVWVNYCDPRVPAKIFVTKRVPESGSIVRTVVLDGFMYYEGLAWDPRTANLYAGAYGWGVIWWRSASGSFVASFPPPPGFTITDSVEFDASSPSRPIWVGQDDPLYPCLIANVTPSGSLVSSFGITLPGFLTGLAYDADTAGGPFLFAAASAEPNWIFMLEPSSGSVISSFSPPLEPKKLGDLAWDGQYLWCRGQPEYPPWLPGWVFRLVAHAAPNVAPASLGRIKALYR